MRLQSWSVRVQCTTMLPWSSTRSSPSGRIILSCQDQQIVRAERQMLPKHCGPKSLLWNGLHWDKNNFSCLLLENVNVFCYHYSLKMSPVWMHKMCSITTNRFTFLMLRNIMMMMKFVSSNSFPVKVILCSLKNKLIMLIQLLFIRHLTLSKLGIEMLVNLE